MNAIKFLLILMVSTFATAQEKTWSLQNCIDKALENNIEIKIRQLEIKRVQKSRNSVWNQFLPNINFNATQSYNFGSTIDPSTNGRISSNIQNDVFFMNANMSLVDFTVIANAQKNKIEIEIAKVNKQIIENEYKLQLLDSYFQAVFSQELLKIQQEQFKNAVFNLNRILKEVEIGRKPKSDLYDMQLSFAQEEKRILETKQLFLSHKTQLFQLINAPNIDVLSVILISDAKSFSIENIDVNENPKIKFAKLNYQSNLKEIQIQKSSNFPVLSTFYSISSFYFKPLNQPNIAVETFRNQINDNKNQQVGIQLSVPIFNGFRNAKKSVAAKIESEKSKLVIEKEQQKINNQIAFEKLNKLNFKILESKINETLVFAKASFETTQNKFLSGKVDADVLSAVKNQLLNLEYDVLKNSLQLQYTDLKIKMIAQN